tara:strand:+ start:548 stop:766 length:219 start_codon:yes stop_codon:yes gene_type:complete
VSFLVIEFQARPAFSDDEATLSFGTLLVPNSVVIECIFQAKKSLKLDLNSPRSKMFTTTQNNGESATQSCYQ